MSRLMVFIGRFQPVHAGHIHVINHALATSDHALILVGSANRARSWKNPFTFEERQSFIKTLIPDPRLHIAALDDALYDDDAWQRNVTRIVSQKAKELGADHIALTGFDKDASSKYLTWFPDWDMAPVDPYLINGEPLHATSYRKALFAGENTKKFGTDIVLKSWMSNNPDIVTWIKTERDAVEAYKKKMLDAGKALGYPISVCAVDALVTAQNKILLVQRNKAPGAGQWALPGGHIDAGETSKKAALRELGEEAQISLDTATLGRSQVFDHPDRSDRGWIRTEAFHIPLATPQKALADHYEIRATRWVDLNDLDPTQMFEDHYDIIQTMLAPTAIAQAA